MDPTRKLMQEVLRKAADKFGGGMLLGDALCEALREASTRTPICKSFVLSSLQKFRGGPRINSNNMPTLRELLTKAFEPSPEREALGILAADAFLNDLVEHIMLLDVSKR